MSVRDIIRAWKDEDFRETLTPAQQARLPEHPAGALEVSDAHLGQTAGGTYIPFRGYQTLSTFCSAPIVPYHPSTILCNYY